MKKILIFALLFTLIGSSIGFAQEVPFTQEQLLDAVPKQEGATPTLITQLAVLAGLAILPFAVMLLTSYVKVVIVLSLLRSALGVQQSPPNQVINGIALLVTLYVMFPTGVLMYNAAGDYMKENAPKELFTGPSAVYMINVAEKAKEPLRQFLLRNSVPKNVTSFYQLAYKTFPAEYRQTLKPGDFIVLIPAFITSQLKTAFEIGVLIYLPFFVIDLVTSNILLLVMVDGWTVIVQGLTMSFKT